MKLLLDEMYPPAVASGLRRRGVDAVGIQEEEPLRGLSDADVFVVAQLDARCVVTENVADFVAVEAAWRAGHDAPHRGLFLVSPSAFPRHRARVVGTLVAALAASVEAGRPEPGTVAWLS